jgi:hypothetical protein
MEGGGERSCRCSYTSGNRNICGNIRSQTPLPKHCEKQIGGSETAAGVRNEEADAALSRHKGDPWEMGKGG